MGVGKVVVRDSAVVVDAAAFRTGIVDKELVALVVIPDSHLGVSAQICLGGFWQGEWGAREY